MQDSQRILYGQADKEFLTAATLEEAIEEYIEDLANGADDWRENLPESVTFKRWQPIYISKAEEPSDQGPLATLLENLDENFATNDQSETTRPTTRMIDAERHFLDVVLHEYVAQDYEPVPGSAIVINLKVWVDLNPGTSPAQSRERFAERRRARGRAVIILDEESGMRAADVQLPDDYHGPLVSGILVKAEPRDVRIPIAMFSCSDQICRTERSVPAPVLVYWNGLGAGPDGVYRRHRPAGWFCNDCLGAIREECQIAPDDLGRTLMDELAERFGIPLDFSRDGLAVALLGR